MSVEKLIPYELWSNFAALNAVPRPSKKEERVIQFMLDFGSKNGLETFTDKINNVIIKKPASPGFENRKTVILQSHLDMVHQKNADKIFDFENQGIEMIIDGEEAEQQIDHQSQIENDQILRQRKENQAKKDAEY